MGLILNLETSSTNCSVSLSEGEAILQLTEDKSADYSHGEQLHIFISKVLKEQGVYIKDLSAIAISEGPGSYTGLRIGVAAAKGFCHVYKLPLISISTLEAMAHLAKVEEDSLIIPALDARRNDLYYAILSHKYTIIKNNRADTLTDKLFEPFKNSLLHFVGPGAEKAQHILYNSSLNTSFLYGPDYLPTAKTVAKLAYKKFKAKNFEALPNFEPIYLRVC